MTLIFKRIIIKTVKEDKANQKEETIEFLTNLIENTDEGSSIELLDGATMELTTEQGGYVANIKVADDII